MNRHVLVVGSLNMDLVIRSPRLPKPGETLLGSSFKTYSGGKGANQAVAAARMGAPVQMIGWVGTDSFGRQLVASLERDGVDVRFIREEAATPTGVAVISVDSQGQNTIIVAPGANALLTPADLRLSADAFRGAGVLLLQLESPLEAVGAAVAMAKEHGALVVLNPAPAQPLEAALLSKVDFLILNETETETLTVREHPPDLTEAAGLLLNTGVKHVIVTQGKDGALYIDGASRQASRFAGNKVTVVDTTAAGDAFAGAFAVAILEGAPPGEAVRWGNLAGALAVTRTGAQPSLPTRREFEQFRRSVRID